MDLYQAVDNAIEILILVKGQAIPSDQTARLEMPSKLMEDLVNVKILNYYRAYW